MRGNNNPRIILVRLRQTERHSLKYLTINQTMRFFKKTHLKWQEPSTLRKEYRNRVALKQRLHGYLHQFVRVFFIVAALLAVLSLLRGQLPGSFLDNLFGLLFASLIISIFISLVGGIGDWLYEFVPSQICIQDDGIRRITGQVRQFMSYREIRNCAIWSVSLEANQVKVLEIMSHDGRVGYIEMPPEISEERLVEILSQKGIIVNQEF
jgi:hypothetical protein